jgi:hypothetical protein
VKVGKLAQQRRQHQLGVSLGPGSAEPCQQRLRHIIGGRYQRRLWHTPSTLVPTRQLGHEVPARPQTERHSRLAMRGVSPHPAARIAIARCWRHRSACVSAAAESARACQLHGFERCKAAYVPPEFACIMPPWESESVIAVVVLLFDCELCIWGMLTRAARESKVAVIS